MFGSGSGAAYIYILVYYGQYAHSGAHTVANDIHAPHLHWHTYTRHSYSRVVDRHTQYTHARSQTHTLTEADGGHTGQLVYILISLNDDDTDNTKRKIPKFRGEMFTFDFVFLFVLLSVVVWTEQKNLSIYRLFIELLPSISVVCIENRTHTPHKQHRIHTHTHALFIQICWFNCCLLVAVSRCLLYPETHTIHDFIGQIFSFVICRFSVRRYHCSVCLRE